MPLGHPVPRRHCTGVAWEVLRYCSGTTPLCIAQLTEIEGLVQGICGRSSLARLCRQLGHALCRDSTFQLGFLASSLLTIPLGRAKLTGCGAGTTSLRS